MPTSRKPQICSNPVRLIGFDSAAPLYTESPDAIAEGFFPSFTERELIFHIDPESGELRGEAFSHCFQAKKRVKQVTADS